MAEPVVRPDSGILQQELALARAMSGFFDPVWYVHRYPDVAAAGLEPIVHFLRHGLAERRDPNRFFDSAWYVEHYPDVSLSGQHPLLHYLQAGAAELRNPHPRFDAAYYAEEHPEAAANPLLYHINAGAARGYLTEKPLLIRDYLPSDRSPCQPPDGLTVDVVIPVYRGLEETRRCLETVLADTAAPLGRVIVIEDRSPEPELVAWLKDLAGTGTIVLEHNKRNLGFVRSVNRGMELAGDRDVVLLNSDTEVPRGWLLRLAGHAYAGIAIASVSPFSNNATICGYPGDAGSDLPFGLPVDTLDRACQAANAGRFVEVPTTVGFCMYIRRAALDRIGLFDAERYGRGYGEENDFCMAAGQAGWKHRLACDIFVYHKGHVSFGDNTGQLTVKAMKALTERFPGFQRMVARHVAKGEATPFRFAVTARLFRESGLPVIAMISHELGGGVSRHAASLVRHLSGKAHFLILEATDRGAVLSVPELPNHPSVAFPAERVADLVALLTSMGVTRVHLHHLLGMDLDIRDAIRRLGVPFDVTIHDYYGLCPQMNLLPAPADFFCGEPGIAGCNACIAQRPSAGARDIVVWRAEREWLFRDADRVLCPSQDVLDRLRRFGVAARAVLAPHEPVPAGPWPADIPPLDGKLRIALLGVLADHKGARTVAAVAEMLDPGRTELHLIGHTEENFPAPALKRLRMTGKYNEADLPGLIRKIAPHVIWFPGATPETYSYTLTGAIAAGPAIAASNIGAFTGRLAGRPLTWLSDARTSPAGWLAVFDTIRQALATARPAPAQREKIADFYAGDYLNPPLPAPALAERRERIVAVVPERYNNGAITPCGYIRLIQPVHHPAAGPGGRFILCDEESVLNVRADAILTQRYALTSPESAGRVIDRAKRSGAALIYDLDDDLLNIPPKHPDAAELRPRAKIVRRVLEMADSVWVSTDGLRASLGRLRPDATVIENRLDERIWTEPTVPVPFRDDPVRILCMGTSTHDRDFALIEPALARLKAEHGAAIAIDVMGMTTRATLADGLTRIGPPPQASRSYPGFVSWIGGHYPRWHIGVAPLLDTAFNRAKSAIKTMDYAALGLATLASDVPVYRGSIADGIAGQLVPADPRAWFVALDWLVRDQRARRELAANARPAFLARATLAGHAEVRREAWSRVLPGLQAPAPSLPLGHDTSDLTATTKRRRGRGG